MRPKNINDSETPEEIMNAGRRAYAGEATEAVKACPLSENAIAFALGEPAAVEDPHVKDHLQTCRACVNLVDDVRAAQIEAQQQIDSPAKVLSALSEAIEQFERPSLLKKWAAGLRMPSLAPKIIATAATAGLAFMIVHSSLKDPETVRQYQRVTKKIAPAESKGDGVHTTARQSDPSENELLNESSAANSISIHDNWSTDPFEPILGDKPAVKKAKKRMPRTPLERIDLSQLKLVAVMQAAKENKALVEDASGKGYVIKKGSYIGINAGKVIEILKDKVIIEETIEDVHGNMVVQKKEIKLHKP